MSNQRRIKMQNNDGTIIEIDAYKHDLFVERGWFTPTEGCETIEHTETDIDNETEDISL